MVHLVPKCMAFQEKSFPKHRDAGEYFPQNCLGYFCSNVVTGNLGPVGKHVNMILFSA